LSIHRMIGPPLIIMLSKVKSHPLSLEENTGCSIVSSNDAEAATAIYSVIETAKANQLKPYQYLHHIFTMLPKAKL